MSLALYEQIDFLLTEARTGSISMHELMKLLDVAYRDYLDFHPEEMPAYYNVQGRKLDERRTQPDPDSGKTG